MANQFFTMARDIAVSLHHPIAPPIVPQHVDFDSFDEATAREWLGFDFIHIEELHDQLHWPDFIFVEESDPSKSFSVDGKKAFLFLLYQHRKNTDFTVCETFWGWRYSTSSRILRAAEQWLVDNHGHRLSEVDYFQYRFPLYNAALLRKIEENGDQIPLEAVDCCGFVDRCSFRVAKPSVQIATLFSIHKT